MWLAINNIIPWPYFDITSLGGSVFSNLHFLGLALFYSQVVFWKGLYLQLKCFQVLDIDFFKSQKLEILSTLLTHSHSLHSTPFTHYSCKAKDQMKQHMANILQHNKLWWDVPFGV